MNKSQKRKRFYISFVRAPGVGKTTTANGLRSALKNHGYAVMSGSSATERFFLKYGIVKRYFLVLFCAIRHKQSRKTLYKLVFIFLKFIARLPSVEDVGYMKDAIKMYFLRNYLVRHTEKENVDICIYDEAILHVVARITTRKITPVLEDLVCIFSLIGESIMVLIFLDAPADVALKRISSKFERERRGYVANNIFFDTDNAQKHYLNHIENLKSNKKKIIQLLEKKRDTAFIEVNATLPVYENAEKIIKLLLGAL